MNVADADVDLALVLAVDCSSSVDAGDFHLQMRGIASALRNPLLLAAIASGPKASIAIALVHWSTRDSQAIVLPWHLLALPADIEAAAGRIEKLERHWKPGGTGLAAAILFCASLLLASPFKAARRAIDISGDGEDNEGGNAALARDAAVALGVSISGLPIIDGSQLLENYYRREVIGGPGSFLMPAKNLLDFKDAMTRKLLREIERATV